MSEECVVAVYASLEKGQQAVHTLDRGDFPAKQISLVTRPLEEQPEVMEDIALGDDSARDAAIGAGLGAILGVLAGVAVTVVSGLGAVFLAGPIGGGIVGAAAGAFLAGLKGWGVHQEHIHHYQNRVKEGDVLVIAHGDPLELVHAHKILTETDPVELHTYAKTSSETPEIQQ
ncbi:hypothetical protein Pan97_16460 [Bremerella volcania]|uniref:DUF1269 domain-containing protein n=1 Tax=Bremerella volcania TaxID=2527984 RepID=A0A518C600_9BACT|nr:hypothetical protein [Bremerella volcania]QDU74634.1 hypothetical protein Pan97_16460 [Bremerella volcania]